MRIVFATHAYTPTMLAPRVVNAIGYHPIQIAVWGLTFKADTDDLHDSPAIDLIHGLAEMGINTAVYDPLVNGLPRGLNATLSESALAAATGADAVVVVTEWPEFRHVDLGDVAVRMRGTTIVDFRHVLSSDAVNTAGLNHHSIGSPPSIATGHRRSSQLMA